MLRGERCFVKSIGRVSDLPVMRADGSIQIAFVLFISIPFASWVTFVPCYEVNDPFLSAVMSSVTNSGFVSICSCQPHYFKPLFAVILLLLVLMLYRVWVVFSIPFHACMDFIGFTNWWSIVTLTCKNNSCRVYMKTQLFGVDMVQMWLI